MTTAQGRWDGCKKMVWRATWHWHYRTGVPVKDLYSEALYLFMKAHAKYDKKRHAKFSSYLHIVLHTKLSSFSAREFRERRHSTIPTDSQINIEVCTTFRTLLSTPPKFIGQDWCWRFNELSSETQDIIRLIYNAPAEVLGLDRQPLRPRIIRSNIAKLLKTNGWHPTTIHSAFNELKQLAAKG